MAKHPVMERASATSAMLAAKPARFGACPDFILMIS
jgi:hypothetical protein